MPTLDLRTLEEAGLVSLAVYPSIPFKVEYVLTSDGRRLGEVVVVLQEFGLWLKAKVSD
ncbi:winged helix-turn-helix transcriptional regulator [Agrobacterium pusense]|nr:winged helix-turn-helix transcriptional regulator [Agrobacterium pusense]